jgi:hypothetical protein
MLQLLLLVLLILLLFPTSINRCIHARQLKSVRHSAVLGMLLLLPLLLSQTFLTSGS